MFGVGASSAAASSIAVPAEQPTDAITANPEQAATTANASFINTLAPQSVISATSVAAATTIPAAKPAPVAITPATVAAAPSDGSTASAAATSTIEVKDAVSLGLLSPCWLGLGPKVDIAFSQPGPPRFFS
mmetsp:Transcript_40316/g.130934  ORF Transcript_40316/g.130934 Transcript_40316/m.130934 type:complete len:131 (+) Transcript_40316:1173-1565(+)